MKTVFDHIAGCTGTVCLPHTLASLSLFFSGPTTHMDAGAGRTLAHSALKYTDQGAFGTRARE